MLEPNPGSPNLAENLARTLGEPWERDETSGSDRDDVRHARRIDSTTGTPRRHRITHGAVATIIARPASSGNRTVFFVPFGRASVARSFLFLPNPPLVRDGGRGGYTRGPPAPRGYPRGGGFPEHRRSPPAHLSRPPLFLVPFTRRIPWSCRRPSPPAPSRRGRPSR